MSFPAFLTSVSLAVYHYCLLLLPSLALAAPTRFRSHACDSGNVLQASLYLPSEKTPSLSGSIRVARGGTAKVLKTRSGQLLLLYAQASRSHSNQRCIAAGQAPCWSARTQSMDSKQSVICRTTDASQLRPLLGDKTILSPTWHSALGKYWGAFQTLWPALNVPACTSCRTGMRSHQKISDALHVAESQSIAFSNCPPMSNESLTGFP